MPVRTGNAARARRVRNPGPGGAPTACDESLSLLGTFRLPIALQAVVLLEVVCSTGRSTTRGRTTCGAPDHAPTRARQIDEGNDGRTRPGPMAVRHHD